MLAEEEYELQRIHREYRANCSVLSDTVFNELVDDVLATPFSPRRVQEWSLSRTISRIADIKLKKRSKTMKQIEDSQDEFRAAANALKALSCELKKSRTSIINIRNDDERVTENDELVLPGTWVECCRCAKWRYLERVHDPSFLEPNWNCAMDPAVIEGTLGSHSENACEIPESPFRTRWNDAEDCVFGQFAAGSLVWAKMTGYPEWPAMVCYNAAGRYCQFDSSTREVTHYHVVFLDPAARVTTRLLRANKLKRFSARQHQHNRHTFPQSRISKSCQKRLEAAIEEAEAASNLSIYDRIDEYGYDFEAEVSRTRKRGPKQNISKEQSIPTHASNSCQPTSYSHSKPVDVATTPHIPSSIRVRKRKMKITADTQMDSPRQGNLLPKNMPTQVDAATTPINMFSVCPGRQKRKEKSAVQVNSSSQMTNISMLDETRVEDVTTSSFPISVPIPIAKTKRQYRPRLMKMKDQSQPIVPIGTSSPVHLVQNELRSIYVDDPPSQYMDASIATVMSPSMLKPIDPEFGGFWQPDVSCHTCASQLETEILMDSTPFPYHDTDAKQSPVPSYFMQRMFQDLRAYSHNANEKIDPTDAVSDISSTIKHPTPSLHHIPFHLQLRPATTHACELICREE